MLKQLFGRIFGGLRPTAQALSELREQTAPEGAVRDLRAAAEACRRYLKYCPDDAEVLNNLGCYLYDLGEEPEAIGCFDAAYALDHNFIPAVINHARTFITLKRADEGLESLRRAKAANPDGPNIANIYGSMALLKGRTAQAHALSRSAWLGMFDNLRGANAFLFGSAYADIDGRRLASEHRFWSETQVPWRLPDDTDVEDGDPSEESLKTVEVPPKGTRIRIAYWSPDLRNHSVGLFALPLFLNHDRSRFEIIVYFDFRQRDPVSKQIEQLCDHFIPSCEMTDQTLAKLMLSHDLDVLVECAGHTSANRLNLLQQRFARLQITALGYPPTTGLSTIDAKLLDVHIVDDDVPTKYTEAPMVMSQSFWCFGPPDPIDIAPEPPCVRNGYVTFACVGNIAKIHPPMLKAWLRILDTIDNARLLIRSMSFADTSALSSFERYCQELGMDMSRVSLAGPEGGANYYATYNEVDIILDTFPFNGGTTTCFATFMGVPVVSMQGDSLVSRMGKSILSNLGLTDWIVSSYEEYVDTAITKARDPEFLRVFRAEARQRYQSTALGNGAMFTREFEEKCEQWLLARPSYNHRVAPLPEDELIARAYRVFRYGQFEAGQRIVDHCLREYPQCGTAHVLLTQRWTASGDFGRAATYLRERVSEFASAHQFNAWVNIARYGIYAEAYSEALYAIEQCRLVPTVRSVDVEQLLLLEAWESTRSSNTTTRQTRTPVPTGRICVIWVGDDFAGFLSLREKLSTGTIPQERLVFEQCLEKRRVETYLRVLRDPDIDYVVIMQKSVDLIDAASLSSLLAALEEFDLVGIGGARSWRHIAWRHDEFTEKADCRIAPSGERAGWYEVNVSGAERRQLSGGFVVLDGNLLATKRARFDSVDVESLFDAELDGGGLYLEEFFTHSACRAGLSLGVRLHSGVVIDWRVDIWSDNLGDASWQIAKRLGIDPLECDDGDRTVVSVPVEDAQSAARLLDFYLTI